MLEKYGFPTVVDTSDAAQSSCNCIAYITCLETWWRNTAASLQVDALFMWI